ncbi:hypothetical protein [uncultured Tateyamaria sp.]|uniref:hypothetical protein n=1 Tax=uncultured Tateyamaria sp. TaxID=455651 RepID=UPI0026090AF4|nr:hypothetical protein [uncultured Tateyamaria sp.]
MKDLDLVRIDLVTDAHDVDTTNPQHGGAIGFLNTFVGLIVRMVFSKSSGRKTTPLQERLQSIISPKFQSVCNALCRRSHIDTATGNTKQNDKKSYAA